MANEVAVAQSTAVATEGAYNAFEAFGDSGNNIIGDLLKFTKGEWVSGPNDDEVEEGTRVAVDMNSVKIGWVRWWDGAPTDEEMVTIASGQKPQRRADLGDDDEQMWEEDNDGRPKDPWQNTVQLVCKTTDGEQEYTFSSSSAGGRNAVKALCKAYGQKMRSKPGMVPIVSLEVDSYKHKEYGKTFVPVLKIVDWASEEDLMFDASEEVEGEDQSEDEVEEEEAPKATKPARTSKGKPRF